MKKFIQLFYYPLLFSAATLLFSCETTSEQDRAAGTNTESPTNSQNADINSANDGSAAGSDNNNKNEAVNETGGTNEGASTSGGGKATPQTNQDTKANGVREPNEYPSGRAGGQYTNPNATTTPSGTNTNENPGTGSPSKSSTGGK